MAQQLTVKAYLKRWNAERRQLEPNEEIRRFSVDQDVATSYEYLMAKVTAVFPGLRNKSFTLYWKDADNDMIAFSSDDELMEAVKNVSDSILRIFIHERPGASSSGPAPAPTTEPLHFGVTCDGCEGEVRGVRYKCSVCPDYDLCGGCKSTGLHTEHEMKTITVPLPPWGAFYRMGFPHPPPPPPPPPGFGPPPQYGAPPQYVPPPTQPPQCDPRQAQRMARRAWKRWYKEVYGDDHKRKMKKERKEEKKDKKAAKAAAAAAGEDETKKKDSTSSSSSESEAEQSPGSEYLKNVGESVAAMLDPLGIDVQVDVETNGGQRRVRCGRRMNGHGGPWAWHGMRGGRCGPWGMRGGGGGPGRFGCHMRGHFAPQQAPPAAAPPAAASVPPEQAAAPRDPETNSETGEVATGPQADNGWTLVNGGSADVDGATSGVEQLHVTVAAEDIPSARIQPAMPMDPKIEEAVQQMMSMGYNNEGYWLTQLLVDHNGDIGRALDAIHAMK